MHNWYNFVLGFSDKLVSTMMDELDVGSRQLVFDPFCGTGTTLVECMKEGISSVGLDSSPFSCFVSRVKTNRTLDADELLDCFPDIKNEFLCAKGDFKQTATYKYLEASGMLKRKWIGRAALRDALAIRAAIKKVVSRPALRDLFFLALTADLSVKIGNMRYGPEIYRGRDRRNVDVWGIFQRRVLQVICDLESVSSEKLGVARVIQGDARDCGQILRRKGIRRIHAAISSPPYPTEHDYTRNTRLELAFLDLIEDKEGVREIKQNMIRSHTKGIYSTDEDAKLVAEYKSINLLAEQVAKACRGKEYGFARLYPTVIREYFGGMKRHFGSISSLMREGSKYAVVVGDQSSYFGIQIPTAELLGEVAKDCGFKVEKIMLWRERWATKSSKLIKEHALILRKFS